MSDTSTNTIIQNFLGTKTGKALLYIILIGVGVVLIRQIFKAPNEDSKIPIITILEKVIKIQQLELVNFYSDHILVLGRSGRIGKCGHKHGKRHGDCLQKCHSPQVSI